MKQRSALPTDERFGGLQALVGRLMVTGDEERRELARQLHDDATQRLAFLQFEAERLKQASSVAGVRAGLERLGKEINELATLLRNLSQRLHPAAVEHLGVPSALRSLADRFRQEGLDMILSIADLSTPPPLSVGLALYRITEEALANALNHAPNSTVSLRLREVEQEIELSIADTGPGFDSTAARANGALGLLSMEERARVIFGSLQVDSSLGGGTVILVRAPVPTA